MTPLHVAAESGRFEIVDSGYLVGKKTDINVKDNSEVNMCDQYRG